MRYVSRCLLLVLFCFSPIFAYGGDSAEEVNKNIHTEEVEYAAGGVTLKGYLAYDTSIKGKRPGVLVVHEWWGHNEYARKRARMLAKLGYTALAVDMYGSGKTADHPDDATRFMNEVLENMERGEARFNAALGILKRHSATDPERIAAIGYCFGGGVVLHMARSGADLRGVASFHGSLGSSHTPEPGSVKAKVLVMHGADDRLIPPRTGRGIQNARWRRHASDYRLYRLSRRPCTVLPIPMRTNLPNGSICRWVITRKLTDYRGRS